MPMQEVAERTIWDMALTRDVDGYAIKPHSDNARKWVRLSHNVHLLAPCLCVVLHFRQTAYKC